MANKKVKGREYSSNWGGVRQGQGRPKKTEGGRNRNIGIRVSEEELAMIKAKSAISGLGMTDFIIECVKKA